MVSYKTSNYTNMKTKITYEYCFNREH